MLLKVKKLIKEAVIPTRSKYGDAGFDLFAISRGFNTNFVEYFTGLAIEIPYGFVGLIFPRSSLSKYDIVLANSVGVVDSGYRGEISIRFKTVKDRHLDTNPVTRIYDVGDRVAQLVVLELPAVVLEEVEELSTSERGENGYGSTGK